jgi:murein DD-endopeptidase MepM/ murein hydrolase activator NlpD
MVLFSPGFLSLNFLPNMLKLSSLFLSFLWIKVLATSALATPAPKLEFKPVLDSTGSCQTAVLSNLQRHRVQPGETLDSIARQYQLLPGTLAHFNPQRITPGTEVIIPPVDGRRVQVPQGITWSELAEQYGIRGDVLFEMNGCQPRPTTVFIPGVNWSSSSASPRTINRYTGLAGYPLATLSQVALSYGWYVHPKHQQRIFHSGIDILSAKGTTVLAADQGVVAFAAQRGNYGNLVVINHPDGLQTRYAHLDQIQVQPGQNVSQGDEIGTVGTTGQPDLTAAHLHFEVRYNSALGWVAQDPSVHLQED